MNASAEIIELTHRLGPAVSKQTVRSPLRQSEWLSELCSAEVWLKCENLQHTGSFKARGAIAALENMEPQLRAEGVVSCSTGNHGQALAWAAGLYGTQATIVVPQNVAPNKAAKIRSREGKLVEAPVQGYDAAEAWTLEHLAELGGCFVSAFEDPAVMAGNGGTTLLEIVEEDSGFDRIVAPCGGGGLVSGLAVLAREKNPKLRVAAVCSERSPAMFHSRRDNKAWLRIDSEPTIADGVEGGVGALNFSLVQEFVQDVVLASEASTRLALCKHLLGDRLPTEGSAALPAAALIDGALGDVRGERICLILSGANLDPKTFSELVGEQT